MIDQKIRTLIGFAICKRSLKAGTNQVEEALKKKGARLVIMATDVNPKRFEYMSNWCESENVPIILLGTKDEWGEILKAKPTGILAIKDSALVEGILDHMNNNPEDK